MDMRTFKVPSGLRFCSFKGKVVFISSVSGFTKKKNVFDFQGRKCPNKGVEQLLFVTIRN